MAAGDWRVSDAEREAVATALGMHLAAGRLSMDEFRARLNDVYAAESAADLAAVTADLPVAGPSVMGAGAGAPLDGGVPGGPSSALGIRRAITRVLAAGALLALTGVTGMIMLIGALLGHGGLLVPSLILLAVPVALLALAGTGLVWAGRRAWRNGGWLELVPAAAGAPWLGRALWATRVLLVGRVFWRIGRVLGRPVHRKGGGHAPANGGVWYQAEPGGEWHQARVGDLRGTTR